VIHGFEASHCKVLLAGMMISDALLSFTTNNLPRKEKNVGSKLNEILEI
jgi:hypothetical protein